MSWKLPLSNLKSSSRNTSRNTRMCINQSMPLVVIETFITFEYPQPSRVDLSKSRINHSATGTRRGFRWKETSRCHEIPHDLVRSGARVTVNSRNGTRLSTAPSFSPCVDDETDARRSRWGKSDRAPPRLVSLSYISRCASCVGRWQCTGGLAPDTPYVVTLSQPRGILSARACNSRSSLSSSPSRSLAIFSLSLSLSPPLPPLSSNDSLPAH